MNTRFEYSLRSTSKLRNPRTERPLRKMKMNKTYKTDRARMLKLKPHHKLYIAIAALIIGSAVILKLILCIAMMIYCIKTYCP